METLFSHENNAFLPEHTNFYWLFKLSEVENLENLKDRIIDAASNERNGLLIISLSVVLVNAGLIICVLGNSMVAYVIGIFAVVLGSISTVFGFFVSVHFVHKYNNLLEEFYTIAER